MTSKFHFFSKKVNLVNAVSGIGANEVIVEINGDSSDFSDSFVGKTIEGTTNSTVKVDVVDSTDNSVLGTKTFTITPTTTSSNLLYSIIIGGTKSDISIGLLDDNSSPQATAALSQFRIVYMGESNERRDIYTQQTSSSCNITNNAQPLATKNSDLGAGDIVDFYSMSGDSAICITAVGATNINAIDLESFTTGLRKTVIIKADNSFTSYDR